MASFEYQSLQKHLESRGRFLGGIVNHILRTAQDNTEDGTFDISIDDIPFEFDFLEDRELIADMLAERPEIANASPHNYGFELWLREPVQEMTADDIRIRDELLIEDDHVNAYLEVWFDIGKRFGLPTLGEDDSVNLYADYYSMNERLDVCCIIKYADGTDSETIPLKNMTGSEKEMILEHMREAGLEDCLAELGAKPTQAELETIYEKHYDFLKNLPGGECADFSGMLLSGLEMRNMDFSGANFSGAALDGCDMEHGIFEGCDFSGAHFYGVQAGNASMELSDFTGTHFEGSNFRHANFENSNCSNAVFEHVNLHKANLDLCDFAGAEFIGTSLATASTVLSKDLAVHRPLNEAQTALEVTHARHTLWRHGQLDGQQANFSSQALTKLDFSGKEFDGALFGNAEISRCDMRSGDFFACDFNGAAIEGCDFTGASCQDADFTGAQLHGCDFSQTELCGADFSQAEIYDCTGLDDVSQGPTMRM